MALTDPSAVDQVADIIDSSALAKYAAKEPGWLKIEEYISNGDFLELALVETSNALWKKIRRKEISLDSAKKIIAKLIDILWFLDQQKYMERALEIAAQQNVTVYDALFLACAEMESSKLVSCDSRQIEVASKLGIKSILV